jgi:hypothetical protein
VILLLKVLMAKKHKKSDAWVTQVPSKVEVLGFMVRRHDPTVAPAVHDGMDYLHYLGTIHGPRGQIWVEAVGSDLLHNEQPGVTSFQTAEQDPLQEDEFLHSYGRAVRILANTLQVRAPSDTPPPAW